MIRCIRFRKAVFACVLILAGISQAAARNGRTPDPSMPQNQAPTKRDLLRLDAQKTHAQIDALLTQMLTAVKENNRPTEKLIQSAKDALESNKQNALAYDEKQRADYMLLQAWTGYFQGNMPEALSWSMRASKQDTASQDAWISQALFSMLTGKRPALPRIETPAPETETQRVRPQRVRPQRPNMEPAQPEYDPKPYTDKGVLDFDLLAVRAEFFREKFERLQCKTTDGQVLEYVPGQDMLCAFFWQSVETVADTNELGAVAPAAEMIDMSYDMGAATQAAGLDEQRQYFTRLMDACKNASSVKFLQIDTIRPRNLQKLDLTNYDNKGIPSVIASLPESNAQRFACDASKPFMMIIDKTGSVKYSGPAAGFMPAFILAETSGQAISLAPKTEQGQMPEMGLAPFGEMTMQPNIALADPNAPQPEPNMPVTSAPPAPAQGPNALPPAAVASSASSSSAQSEYDFPMEDTEKQIEAENLLRMGQLKIEQSVKVRGSNPRDGIEACRQVLAKYPNTPYATQAQLLLRKVPQRYKEEYNITDEELGL